MVRRLAYTGFALLLTLGAGWLYLEANPGRAIPSTSASAKAFIGQTAEPSPLLQPLSQAVIQHPYLGRSGLNSMHNDAAQSDAYRWHGPLGRNMRVSSRQFHRLAGNCVAQVFDSQGRMYGTCVTPFGVTLVARNAETLEVLARQVITRWLPIGEKFSGGVYFHLDHHDRVLLATNDLAIQLWQLTEQDGEYRWQLDKALSLDTLLNGARNQRHRIIDVMPDWQGNYWFITRDGLVGSIGRDGSNGRVIALGTPGNPEGIDNAMAVGEHGVFVVSNHAMYRLALATNGTIEVLWREAYDRGSGPKEGTMGHGSGTTPTLMGNQYVAITDNADGQVNVLVYAQEKQPSSQRVCTQPVFPEHRGTTENSLAVAGNALIIENNFAYSGPRNIPESEPGIARVDVLGTGQGCELVWENRSIASPSAVPKISLANGLIYLYTRDRGHPNNIHAWYFTAVDFATGELVYKQLTGTGWLFNNHYGAITLSPQGHAYVGTMGGLVKLQDTD